MSTNQHRAPDPTVTGALCPPPIRRLIVGGSSDIPGWTTLNADPSTLPDILCDITDIEGVADASVSVVYMSHVLEHVELPKVLSTLQSLHRAMHRHGTLFVSVPDMTVLGHLLHDEELDINQKIHVLRMIFGGQVSRYDFHYFGYTFEILGAFLNAAGFIGMRRVKSFGIHQDTSDFMPYKGLPISLNVVCHKS